MLDLRYELVNDFGKARLLMSLQTISTSIEMYLKDARKEHGIADASARLVDAECLLSLQNYIVPCVAAQLTTSFRHPKARRWPAESRTKYCAARRALSESGDSVVRSEKAHK